MAALELKGIVKRYSGTEILKGIDIACGSGEFLVLVGPSGCGKSTLLNIIAGLDTADAGSVAIAGKDVGAVPPAARDIAMVFQSYALYPTMTVRQNISFGMEIRKVPKAEREKATAEVARVLQIEPLLDRKISQLSGGQRQRVAMGRALVRSPQVFLFDEPLSNLDAKLRVEMRTEIKKLHQRLNSTIVYVTHDQIEAMTLATRIAIMRAGKVEQLAAPRVLYEEPATMFVAGFIGSPPMNFVPAMLTATAGGLIATVRGAQGDVHLPVAVTKAAVEAGGSLGRPVVLGVRPEHLMPESAELRIDATAAVLPARVDVVEPTGADTMVVFNLGGKDVIARVAPHQAKAPGEAMTFRVAPEKVSVFDAKTEVRIA